MNRATTFVALLALPLMAVTSACGTHASDGRPLDLAFAYQANLELIDLLGPFYHRKQQFPEIREISWMDAVKLERALETPDQEPTDFNLFLVDATQGVLVYSRGLRSLGAVKDERLRGARQIAVTPRGRLGVINAAGRIDPCFAFDGTTVARAPECQTVELEARRISATDAGGFFVVTPANEVVHFDPATGERLVVRLHPHTPAGIVDARVQGDDLLVVHDHGYALSSYRDRRHDSPGGGAQFQFTRVATARDIPVRDHAYSGGPGGGHGAAAAGSSSAGASLQFAALVRTRRGDYFALSPTDDRLLHLDRHLRPLGPLFFNSLPIPFRRQAAVTSLAFVARSDVLHVFSKKVVEGYLLDPARQPDVNHFARHVPSELWPVFVAIVRGAAQFEPDTFDATRSVFDYPGVPAALQQAFAILERE